MTPAAREAIRTAARDAVIPIGGTVVLDPADPYEGADTFLRHRYTENGARTLYTQAGTFYHYVGTHYPALEDAAFRAGVWEFLAAAKRYRKVEKEFVEEPFKPTPTAVNAFIDAIRARSHLPADRPAPCWLDGFGGPPGAELVSLANGLLHIPTRELIPHSPGFFTHNALGFTYSESVPEPLHWLRFLHSLWPDDPESIAVLQTIFGYLLTTDTNQQKAFLLVGPKRSGKGTIARILTALLGAANVCAPTLAGLSTNFGLAPLIGKLLAIISDARLGGRADQAAIAESLLSISGEDSKTIDRKHRESWTGRLPTRFLILSNELPRIADSSGALASRFVVLTLQTSFYGREDTGLTDRLLGELPGIFNWSLDGWDRLTERGHFVQPASSADAIRELEDLGSPIAAFVRDRCRVGPARQVEARYLYEAWKKWCAEEGRDHPGTSQSFGRDLRAAIPGLRVTQHRVPGAVARYYEGVETRPI